MPAGAKSLALICDDPDAPVGTWVHWVLYDLPVTATDLAEKEPASETLSFGVTVNSHLLKPYRQAAKILGIPVRQLVEEYLWGDEED